MTPPSVEVVRLGEQVSEGLDVASRNSRTMLDGERSIEAREALGFLLAEIDRLELKCVEFGFERERWANENIELREALKAIHANAVAWHGPSSSENRHSAALAVIARWSHDPQSIPEGVRAAARDALAAEARSENSHE